MGVSATTQEGHGAARISRLAIVGTGLIGASVGLAAKRAGVERIAGFYDLDQVNQFHEPSVGGVVSGGVFAVRVAPGAEPVLSHEHDSMQWVSPDEALRVVVWPAYRESIRRIVENLLDPARAVWFELTLKGQRARR